MMPGSSGGMSQTASVGRSRRRPGVLPISHAHGDGASVWLLLRETMGVKQSREEGSGSYRCLEVLNDDVLLHIAWMLLADHLPSALRMSIASSAMRERLDYVVRAAEARRLRWLPNFTFFLDISRHSRTITRSSGLYGRRCARPLKAFKEQPWAACRLLPTSGKSSWTVRIDHGPVIIGVCDAANTCGWGLNAEFRRLDRANRDHTGIVADPSSPSGKPPPYGFPDGHRHPLVDPEGNRLSFASPIVEGSIIECIFDADAGSLAFRITGPGGDTHRDRAEDRMMSGPEYKVVDGFPRGQPLRPWARALNGGDRVTISPYHLVSAPGECPCGCTVLHTPRGRFLSMNEA